MGRVRRRYSASGCYHIMLRGNEQKKIFLDDGDHQRFLDILLKKKTETQLLIYAYCLMDNHIHLVVRDDQNEISTIMKGIATSYAMFFNVKYNRVGHVFQGRFKSEPIEDERYLMSVIRYIHNNPVKAKIVEKPNQYEWSSYRSYVNPEETTIAEVRYILGIIGRNLNEAIQEFKRFSNELDEAKYMDEDDEMIKTLEDGRIYLEEYLAKKWPGTAREAIHEDRVMRNEVIQELRTNTDLSIRKIAELLGVNRGVVERLVSKSN
ncbi:MAG TPA: transposase [Gelria sp.]|nr:transposase [Gelria sp.]